MAFQDFRYLREAQPGLDALSAKGVPFEVLAERIRTVMAKWQPGDAADAQHVVWFNGSWLVFIASHHSPATPVLAAVQEQPFA